MGIAAKCDRGFGKKAELCCIAALALLMCGKTTHAGPPPRFERLSIEQGLSQSAIQDIAQDEQGYLWFGTQYGLDRFDGYGFERMPFDATANGQSTTATAHRLLPSQNGRLLISTGGVINRLDPATAKVERLWPKAEERGDGAWIADMIEDAQGRLLLVTNRAVFRLADDGSPDEIIEAQAASKLSEMEGAAMVSGPDGQIWLANRTGLWRYEPDAGRMRRELKSDRPADGFGSVALDSMGRPHYADADGVRRFDPTRGVVDAWLRPSQLGSDPSDRVDALAFDPEGGLWLLLPDAIVRTTVDGQPWQVIDEGELGDSSRLMPRSLRVERDRNGLLWLAGTFGAGTYQPESGQWRRLRPDPADPFAIGPTTGANGYRLLQDSEGTIWLGGGLGGLSRYSPSTTRFAHFLDLSGPSGSGGLNVLRAVLEQGDSLWLAHDGAGLRRYGRMPDGSFELQRSLTGGAGLPHPDIWALAADPKSAALWIANHNRLLRLDGPDGEPLPVPDVQAVNRDAVIDSLAFERDGRRLWAGTSEGLLEIEFGSARDVPIRAVLHPLPDEFPQMADRRLFNLLVLSDGRILAGGSAGALLFEPGTSRSTPLIPVPEQLQHARNFFFGLAEYPDGMLWLGTRGGGLLRFPTPATGQAFDLAQATWYGRENGMVDETVYAIQHDPKGQLWLSSNRGLSRFDPASDQWHHFGPRDGLQDYEFNNTVAHVGDSGRFYFGGINGLTHFLPERIWVDQRPPRLHLTSAEVNGMPGALGDRNLVLPYTDNALGLAFVGLHLADPARNRFTYRLEGADEQWIEAGSSRVARYAQLAPGDYRFWLRGANSDGAWSEPQALLEFRILPPPWLSPWAYAVYAGLALLGFGLAIAAQRGRRLALEALVAERTAELARQREVVARQAQALEAALQARTVLFANVSHEFRTPLTLVQGALDRLQRDGGDPAAADIARRYLSRLLRLVDQLLELARLRQRTEPPPSESWPLDRIVRLTTDAFRHLAEQRGQTLVQEIEPGWQTHCHQEQVERILLNLIGNALKFTPAGGRIEVRLCAGPLGAALHVCDDGPGIPQDQQGLVFERFHRSPATEDLHIPGAGIGLALVNEAAQANGGKVRVESLEGQGSCFIVDLPAERSEANGGAADLVARELLELDLSLLAPSVAGIANTTPAVTDVVADGIAGAPSAARSKRLGTLLIVEDNADLRAHLIDTLANDWRILQAANGEQGLELARNRHPDLILSDIMMPVMDGLELLTALRDDLVTSHIPVLLLTARQDYETRLRSLALAADDFLAKPFEAEELRLRLRNMLDSRRRLQVLLARQLAERMSESSEANKQGEVTELGSDSPSLQRGEGLGRASSLGDISSHPEGLQTSNALFRPLISSRDQRLLDRINAWLEKHFDDPDVSVEQMAQSASVDVRTLQRKLKLLCDQTPGAYLRAFRLARAQALLLYSDRNVTNIALSCGFSSAAYFCRVFGRAHGVPPERWRRNEAADDG